MDTVLGIKFYSRVYTSHIIRHTVPTNIDNLGFKECEQKGKTYTI